MENIKTFEDFNWFGKKKNDLFKTQDLSLKKDDILDVNRYIKWHVKNYKELEPTIGYIKEYIDSLSSYTKHTKEISDKDIINFYKRILEKLN